MARLRNFSPEVLQVMADNIDDNTGELWDFFQDAGAWFEGIFTNARQIQEDLDGLNKYLNRYLELEDITHRELLQILDAVKEVEDRYCRKFKDSTEELRDIRLQLKGFQEEMAGIVQTVTVSDTLNILYGVGISLDDITNDPDKLAQARYDATKRGLALPLTAAQLAASETAYQHIKALYSPTGIGVGGFYQLDWAGEFGSAFANIACYATCMLMIAQYYGHDVSMQELIDGGNIRDTSFGLTAEPYYTETKECYGTSETVYCQRIYEEVADGRPVLVELNGHFVVAVGVIEGATAPYNNNEILVMDPMRNPAEAIDPTSNHWYSLASAIGRKDQNVLGIRTTATEKGKEETK